MPLVSELAQQAVRCMQVILVHPQAYHPTRDPSAAWRWQTTNVATYAIGTQVLALARDRSRVPRLRYVDLMPRSATGYTPEQSADDSLNDCAWSSGRVPVRFIVRGVRQESMVALLWSIALRRLREGFA